MTTPEKLKEAILVSAGVDPNHQTEHCDHCGTSSESLIATCDQYRYLSLCEACYRKAGNSVR